MTVCRSTRPRASGRPVSAACSCGGFHHDLSQPRHDATAGRPDRAATYCETVGARAEAPHAQFAAALVARWQQYIAPEDRAILDYLASREGAGASDWAILATIRATTEARVFETDWWDRQQVREMTRELSSDNLLRHGRELLHRKVTARAGGGA